MKKLISLILVVSMFAVIANYPLQTNAVNVVNQLSKGEYNGFVYSIEKDDSLTITEYKGESEEVGIYNEIDNKKVKTVGESAFWGCSQITSIEIMPNLKVIKDKAFSNCPSLVEFRIGECDGEVNSKFTVDNGALFDSSKSTLISVPGSAKDFEIHSGVKTISDYAFYYCNNLERVTIGPDVSSIGKFAFAHCNSLEEFIVDDNNPYYMSIDGALYDKSCATLIAAPGSIEAFSVPEGVIAVGKSAFAENMMLEKVTLPESIESIGESAFKGCTSLRSVNLPESIESIGESAFKGCTSLRSVNLPYSLKTMGAGIFEDCGCLEEIDIPDSVSEIGDSAFSGCRSLRSVNLPSSLKTIEARMFLYCERLEEIDIPDSVSEIGDAAFAGCQSVVFPDFPPNITRIGSEAFGSVLNIKNIEFSDSLRYIGDYAFYNSGITDITIPDTVTFIGEYAFSTCYNLKEINLPNSITKISNHMFEYSGLTDVVIPDTVTCIGEYAFNECYELKRIVIPKSVTKIDSEAISHWHNENLTIYGDEGSYANEYANSMGIPFSVLNPEFNFEQTNSGVRITKYNSSDTDVVIPNEIDNNPVTEIGAKIFEDSPQVESVKIPKSVTSINDLAFIGCDSLERIEVDPENESFCDVEGILYDKSLSKVIACPAVRSSISLPETVKEVNNNAFYGCIRLKSIDLSDSVEIIGNSAFENCTSLRKIEFSEFLDTIGNRAFCDCESIQNIELPDSVSNIGNTCFSGCVNMKSVNIPKKITFIEKWMFSRCSSLAKIEIPDSVEKIGLGAFAECSGLNSIIVPSSVTKMEPSTFAGCNSMIMYGEKGSYAEIFADLNSISFHTLGEQDQGGSDIVLRADIDLDGEVTASDALIVLRVSVGLSD